MHPVFSDFRHLAPVRRLCLRPRARLRLGPWALWLSLWLWLPLGLAAANVGGTVWEDPDPEATARAVQVQLIRLASVQPAQVEQARLGIEALGLAALPHLQAALEAADQPAATREKIQALVDFFRTATVVTVTDQFGAPVANTGFGVTPQDRVAATREGPEVDPVPTAGADRVAGVNATTDGQGRLVVFGLLPATAACLRLTRLDGDLRDGIRLALTTAELQKQPGEILRTAVVAPRGVRPRLQIRTDRNRPVSHALVLFIPADEATHRLSRLADEAFQFDPATHLRAPAQAGLLAQTRVWNPGSVAADRLGCCAALTDEDGDLQAGRLAPGTYALQIVAAGHVRRSVPEFRVPEGDAVAVEAEPAVLKIEPTARSFCAGTLKTAADQPLQFAVAYLLPAAETYDPAHVQELADFERRRQAQRHAAAIRAGPAPAELPLPPPLPPAATAVAAASAANVPLEYIAELQAYPQVRVARSRASGRIEFKELAEGAYVLRVFVGSADSMEAADLVEFFPADGKGPPTVTAKNGAPVDLATLQYKPAAPDVPAAPVTPVAPAAPVAE